MQTCNLCPRNCKVNRNIEAGVCGEFDTIRIARASLHMWEEPPISGTNGSGTVFFTGCPLHCVFCQNHNIADGTNGVA
ncbi:MAG: radical SAM protein, partial [Clostridia bacterium]|nr:radical SAM protein [Clostridia bacterium]